MRPTSTSAHFEVDSAVILQLGEELVSDDVQALLELAKNAYDADSGYVLIDVDTEYVAPSDDPHWPGVRGRVEVSDGGDGMDRQAIETGWLTVSASAKREMKKSGQVTRRGRTPLGDKGLGRLSTQRLGEGLAIVTHPAVWNGTKNEPQEEVSTLIPWRDFTPGVKLSDLRFDVTSVPYSGPPGTKVTVFGLKNPDNWCEEKQLERLRTELSKLISPYRDATEFVVGLTVNGSTWHLEEMAEELRRGAELSYRIDFDGTKLDVRGRAKLGFFRTLAEHEAKTFEQLEARGQGDGLLQYLLRDSRAPGYQLAYSSDGNWFVEFGTSWATDEMTELERDDGSLYSPGPFHAEVDSFNLARDAVGWQNVFNAVSDYRRYIRRMRGIRIYRDGFGIRVDDDWLRLGSQWTSSGSYYGLKPGNTTGYVALSAKENAPLVETSDREGFADSPHYRNFSRLMSKFVDFSGEVQGYLRREFLEYIKDCHSRVASADDTLDTTNVALAVQERIARVRTGIEEAAVMAEKLEGNANSVVQGKVIARRLHQVASAMEVIRLDVAMTQEQLWDLTEAAGLGLTAEALSHEIHNVADRLTDQTNRFQKKLSGETVSARFAKTYAEQVKASIGALRKQMAHLAPSLRYVRAAREDIDLSVFTRELADEYSDRFGQSGIHVHVEDTSASPFSVRMNRGKLAQVFDNLIINSAYWLTHEATPVGHKREITIELESPVVRLHDNGPGVAPAYEAKLFEPFVTAKPRDEGRGLGLFVVHQLLDSEGCSVALLPARNRHRRRFIFQVDLGGALSERKR